LERKWVVKLKQNSWMNRRPFQFATPFVDGDKVFVGVHREIFYAVDVKKGKKLWTFKTQAPIHAQARTSGEAVFFADTKGMVYALNKENGTPIWASKLEGEVMSAPLIHGDRIYIVTLSKQLAALDGAKGTVLWETSYGSRESGFTVRGSADPVFLNGNILVGYSDGSLAAHDAATGALRWTKQLGDRAQSFHDVDSTILLAGPSTSSGLAYVASADGKFFALDPRTGQSVWQVPVGSVNDAVLQDGFLYVTAGGVTYCFRGDNGQTVWEQALEEVDESSSPVVYGKWLAVVATKGKIYFLDRETGDIKRSWFVKGGSYSDPVLQGNRLFLLSNASRLYSFEFK